VLLNQLLSVIKKIAQNIIWIFPFSSFFLGYFFLSAWYHVERVKTPSLVGTNLPHAFQTLSQHQLNPRLLAIKEDPDIEQGTILSQTPSAGHPIKPHQPVFLVISKKP